MIKITGLKLPLDYSDSTIKKAVAKELKISEKAIENTELIKRSVDARHKNDVHFTAAAQVTVNISQSKVLSQCKSKNASICTPYNYDFAPTKIPQQSPVIVGMGPGGLFAALILAQNGAKPIIIERGKDVTCREKDIKNFWNTGNLNCNSNVQFGEGGAGTFSDGKLNTGTKDCRARKVLEEFALHGAPKEILYNAKPHIGTDKLPKTIENIRKEIIANGGKVMFETTLTDIVIKDSAVTGAAATNAKGNRFVIPTNNIILAIGHSARDTFAMLEQKGIAMEQKPFSVGVRIEHLQSKINKSQYGNFANKGKLGAADYKLAVHLPNGRGVYTFCMCPGGTVVAAASEKDMLVTNGMSEFARDRLNANSALLVGVNPEDFGSENVLAGVEFQRKIERNAFIAGGENYKAPVQRVGDFLQGKASTRLGEVLPSYTAGYRLCSVTPALPDFVNESLKEGIKRMDNKLCGFCHNDAIITAAETRSSSPVRILRNEKMNSINTRGLYPCGEGAGYAGGIISAAVDGIKCAEQILTK